MSVVCSCGKWKNNINKLNSCLTMSHIHGLSYEPDDVFDYCPWCGDILIGNLTDVEQKMDGVISDMVSDLLFYDRKEDDDIPRGCIDNWINSGEITIDGMIDTFRRQLIIGLDE